MQSMSLLHRKKSLFQRLMLLGLMALVLSTALTLTTRVASAKTTSSMRVAASSTSYGCWNTGNSTLPSCDGRSPISTGCTQGAFTARSATSGFLSGGVMETVNLRFNSTCQSAWAEITFNYALPSFHYGNGAIHRLNDNTEYWCSDSGGNGSVLPGQSSCYTPMVGDSGTFLSIADGFYWVGGAWTLETQTTTF